jgi:hypothetical protein
MARGEADDVHVQGQRSAEVTLGGPSERTNLALHCQSPDHKYGAPSRRRADKVAYITTSKPEGTK